MVWVWSTLLTQHQRARRQRNIAAAIEAPTRFILFAIRTWELAQAHVAGVAPPIGQADSLLVKRDPQLFGQRSVSSNTSPSVSQNNPIIAIISPAQENSATMHLGSIYKARSLLLALALLLKFDSNLTAEVNAGSVLALTFIEVRVEARGHAGGVLRQHANAFGEHHASPGQLILMQEISRPERFAALKRESTAVLTDDAREARALAEGLTEDLTAPPDVRLNREFDGIAAATGAQVDARANLYVVTHVDIATPDRSRVETAFRKLAADARHSDGNLGFEILQQIDRPNHFNLISAWLSEAAFRAFVASAGPREFRLTVAPLLGSPYDERLYRRVD